MRSETDLGNKYAPLLREGGRGDRRGVKDQNNLVKYRNRGKGGRGGRAGLLLGRYIFNNIPQ